MSAKVTGRSEPGTPHMDDGGEGRGTKKSWPPCLVLIQGHDCRVSQARGHSTTKTTPSHVLAVLYCIDEAGTDGAAAASRRQHRALGSYRPTEAGRLKGHLDTTLSNSSASLSHLDSRRLAALKAAKKASGGAMTVATTGQMAVGEGGVVNDKHKTYLLP